MTFFGVRPVIRRCREVHYLRMGDYKDMAEN